MFLYGPDQLCEWVETWELIFGNFNEATELWTGVNNVFSDFIIGMTNSRNAAVEAFKALGGFTALIGALQHIFWGLVDAVRPVADAFKEVFTGSAADNAANLAKSVEWLSGHIGYLLQGIGMLLKPLSTLFFGILKVGIGILTGVATVLTQLIPRNLIWAVGEIARAL